jgi:hypothetical protein
VIAASKATSVAVVTGITEDMVGAIVSATVLLELPHALKQESNRRAAKFF